MALFGRRDKRPGTPLETACAAAKIDPASVVDLSDEAGVPLWLVPERPAARAEKASLAMRSAYADSGLWPVLVGDAARMRDGLGADAIQPFEPASVDAALLPDVGSVLAAVAAQGPGGRDDEVPHVVTGVPLQRGAFLDLKDREAIALLPAEPWQVPAMLGFEGALNYDVSGAQHSAVLRHWQQRWGAEVAVVHFDVLELTVAHPPRLPADVVAVAREMYAYCPDIVDQGVGDLESLCLGQVPSTHWYFWWD